MNHTPAIFSPQPLQRERQWTQEGIPLLSLRLTLPGGGGQDPRIRRIDRCYARFARNYERYCARFLLPMAAAAFRDAAERNRPFSPWVVTAAHRVTLLTPELLSLTLELTEPDAAAPLLRRRGDTWDLRDGYPLALHDFFPPDALPLRRLRRLARRELPQCGASLRPDWRLRLRTAASREHFYLTAEGLTFFYPMYALGGAELGIPEFFLPWDAAQGPALPAGFSFPPPLDKGGEAALS